jgi:pimeloyl-ACP methyl ester carboxylesterase
MESSQTVELTTPLGREEIHVVRSGSGAQRYLVWHGFDSVNRLFPWSFLSKSGELFRIGLPGHGPVKRRSWRHYMAWTPEHFIEIAVAVCERFFTGSPLTLVGHSAGAHLAAGAACRVPGIIGRLILINPWLWSPFGASTQRLSRTALWPLVGMLAIAPNIWRKRRSTRSFLEGIRSLIGDRESFYSNPNTPKYVSDGLKDYRCTAIRALVGAARVFAACDLRPTINTARLLMPTLVVHGEKDPVSPVAQSEWLAQQLSGVTLIKLLGVGHVAYGEREAKFAGIVTSWLREKFHAAE